MNLPEHCYLAYVVGYETYYQEVMRQHQPNPYLDIQAAATSGGSAWEFVIDEHEFDEPGTSAKAPGVQLHMFDDSFVAFAQMPEFFTELVEHHPTTLAEVRAILDSLGARDITQRAHP